nr:B312 [uncultured bacterium]
MPARIRFVGRYINARVFLLIGILALIGFDNGGVDFPFLSAALIGAVALSVHAVERMAFLESEEWRKSEERAVELRRQLALLHPQVSEA